MSRPLVSVLTTRDGHLTMLTFAKSGDWLSRRVGPPAHPQADADIHLDADGYTPPPSPPPTRASPSAPQVSSAPCHATVAEAGADGVAAGLIAAGPYTTDVAAEITAARERAKKNGFS